MDSTPVTPQSPDDLSQWGEYAPLVSRVLTGELDGFFVAHENTFEAPLAWPDATPIAKYKNPAGTLFFRATAWSHYGYKTEDAFKSAVKSRKVRCKTPLGIISLGGARKKTGLRVVVKGEGLGTYQAFMCHDDDEAETVSEILRGIYPDRRIFSAVGGVGAALIASGMFDFDGIRKMLVSLPPRWVSTLVMLAVLGVVSILCCFGAATKYLPTWILPVIMLAFPGACIFSLIHIQANASPKVSEEGESK